MLEEQTSTHGKVTALLLKVKVVPASSRDQFAGKLGDRLKIKVAAAPENGLSNRAVSRLVADLLGVATRNVSIAAGQTHPEKIVQITGLDVTAARAALDLAMRPSKKEKTRD